MIKLYFHKFALSIMVSSSFIACVQAGVPEQEKVAPKGKKLHCAQVKLLDIVMLPIAVVRTKVTSAKASKIIQEIKGLQDAYEKTNPQTKVVPGDKKYFASDEEQRAYILGQLKVVMDPVKQFFALISEHRGLVSPIVTESLGITEKDLDKSWFLRFLTTKDDVVIFFDREIKTIDDLKAVCTEFISVFDDLYASLSDGLRKRADDLMQKMRDAQKQVKHGS